MKVCFLSEKIDLHKYMQDSCQGLTKVKNWRATERVREEALDNIAKNIVVKKMQIH